jgi:hypothetical protein
MQAAIDDHVGAVCADGVDITRQVGIALARLHASEAANSDQARALLDWSLQFQPDLVSVIKQLADHDAFFRH